MVLSIGVHTNIWRIMNLEIFPSNYF